VLAANAAANEMYNPREETENSRHCAVTINILSVFQSNILCNMGQDDVKPTWDLILRLIMGTDMVSHFQLLASAKALGRINWKDYAQRVLGLTLVLKLGTIGFACKEFAVCESHLMDIRDELELDPPITGEEGLFVPEPKIPRETRKKKECMAFCHIIALPLLRTMARLIDGVQPLADVCEENMAVWREELYPPPGRLKRPW
jgi:hypothetical protein